MRKSKLFRKFKEWTKYSCNKLNIFVASIALFCILSLSIGYSILSTQMNINTSVLVKGDESIKVSNISNLTTTNSGYEVYEIKYDKETITANIGLPNLDSSVSYDVTIANNTNKVMEIVSIYDESYSNNDIEYVFSKAPEGVKIQSGAILTFSITFKYSDSVMSLPSNTELGAVIGLIYREYEENCEYIQDGLLLNLRGKDAPVDNVWYDTVSSKAMNLTNVTYDKYNKRYYVSGSNSYGTLGQAVIPETGDFTIEAYIVSPAVFSGGTTADMAIVAQLSDTASSDLGRFKLNFKGASNTQYKFLIFTNSTAKNINFFYYFNNNTMTAHKYHLQIVRSGEYLYLYLDGILVDTEAYSSTNKVSQGPFKLARWNDSTPQYYNGSYYAVRVYNKALSNEELMENISVDDYYYRTDEELTTGTIEAYAIKTQLVSEGNGLYDNGDGNFYYKGTNVENYLKIGTSDTLWRIISFLPGNTMKLINVSQKFNIPYDESGYRDSSTSLYCKVASNIADTKTGDFYGCNAWATTTIADVERNASIVDFLNETYYEQLDKFTKSQILTHNFYDGMIKDNISASTALTSAKSSAWKGNVGLITMEDIYYSTTTSLSSISNGTLTISASWIASLSSTTTGIWSTNSFSGNTWDVWTLYNSNYTRKRASRYYQVDGSKTITFYAVPTIYLNSNYTFTGSGSETSPFVIDSSSVLVN